MHLELPTTILIIFVGVGGGGDLRKYNEVFECGKYFIGSAKIVFFIFSQYKWNIFTSWE